jgi:hypothetical protein
VLEWVDRIQFCVLVRQNLWQSISFVTGSLWSVHCWVTKMHGMGDCSGEIQLPFEQRKL